jgi:hypothetical protein
MEARGVTGEIAEGLAQQILQVAQDAGTEQELLIGVEAALGPVLDQLGIPKQAQYEKTLLQGRADAVYGSVTIEYESPGKLETTPGRAESYRQARQYLREQAEIASPGSPEKALPALVGVVLDGFEIGFVVWRAGDDLELDGLSDFRLLHSQLTLEAEEGIAGRFHEIGPIAVSRDSITDLLRFLRALSRRPLEATPLAEEFGPDAGMARDLVGALYTALIESPTPRTEMLYREWLRVFGAVYGEPSAVKKNAVAALGEAYDIPDDDVGRMLFAVHTYFALIMKILAVELVALQAGAVIEPFIAGLSGIADAEFDDRFRELETGRVFRARGIENFLEGDYLGWYVDEWSDDLRRAVRELSRRLSEFEPATATLRPELTQDLLKELYHQLNAPWIEPGIRGRSVRGCWIRPAGRGRFWSRRSNASSSGAWTRTGLRLRSRARWLAESSAST